MRGPLDLTCIEVETGAETETISRDWLLRLGRELGARAPLAFLEPVGVGKRLDLDVGML